MLINIFLPVYNTEPKWIKECLDSIANQTLDDWKVIIIDDVSTSLETCEYLKNIQNTQRCEVHRLDANVGEMFARLEGRNYLDADCKYVAFMDSDDIMMPQRLEKQIDFLEDNRDIGILGAQLQKFYPLSPGRKKVENIVPSDCITSHAFNVNDFIMQKHWTINNPSTMMRREVVEGFDPLMISEMQDRVGIPRNTFGDYVFYAINSSKGIKIRNLSDVLLLYRVQTTQLTQGESYSQENHKRLRIEIWKTYDRKR